MNSAGGNGVNVSGDMACRQIAHQRVTTHRGAHRMVAISAPRDSVCVNAASAVVFTDASARIIASRSISVCTLTPA
jgi:hypothetical protein